MTIRGEVDKDFICMQISSELNIPLEEVRKVVNFQWEELAKHIKSNSQEDFRLPYIGKIRYNVHVRKKNGRL